jgi:formylglycine-generating enzyme required for sulfatase activity
VACFPANGFGLQDMIGNVWEWTRSLWGRNLAKPDFAYPYRADDPEREDLNAGDDVVRVLRGGSWGIQPHLARCSFRGGALPGSGYYNVGFRVVLRSAPVPGPRVASNGAARPRSSIRSPIS